MSDNEQNNEDALNDLRSIHDVDTPQGHITIFESSDKTKTFLKISGASADDPVAKDDILDILDALGITASVNNDVLDKALASLQKGGDLPNPVLTAEGRPPVPGDDGYCEIHFNQENPFVAKGDLLVKVVDGGVGENGEDIYGIPISPNPPQMPNITIGQHAYQQDGSDYFCDIFGKVTFVDNILSVHKILHITVSSDSMEALLSYEGEAEVTKEDIQQELSACNVVYGIDNHAIEYIVASINADGKPVKDFLVARGTPAKVGRNGTIEYSFDLVKGPAYKEKSDGSIDIRETNIIQNVEVNSEIATLIPHIDPEPGKDVYGKSINPPDVTKTALRAAQNVRASEDGLHFFAETSGRPIVQPDTVGKQISVQDVFTVPGDLNLSVGNIDFIGVVEILGNVEDGFTVKSSKSIIVNGLVGDSNLEAGIDITIMGGCNGKTEATIKADGNFEARYVNEANLIVRGDITVKNEIINSDIKSLGRVKVLSGSIRGGTINAKKGIESYDIGSELGVKTVLTPGEDYELTEKINIIDASIIEKNNDMEKINKRITPLLSKKELLPKLPLEQRQKLKETIAYLTQLRQEKDALNNTKNDLIEELMQDTIPEIIINHTVFHGTLLKIGNSRREISSPLQGPLRLFEDNETITTQPYSEKDRLEKEKLLNQTNHGTDESAQTVAAAQSTVPQDEDMSDS